MEVISACIDIHYRLGEYFWSLQIDNQLTCYRFVIKTKEQRAAEKALMDKSPLATLTLEDFLESERHKLTGKLTPVTPDSFAKWKKERLDKKAAEEEARKAKEATGRALFESGNWGEESEEESDDEDEDQRRWNIEQMRKETERLQMQREEERLKGQNGGYTKESEEPSNAPSVNGDAKDEGEG